VAARQDEFERVAMPHTRSLLRVARRLTSEAERAEDLVQQTMLSAWRAFDQFQAGTNARAWLFRILFNAFYAEGRRIRITMVPIDAREIAAAPAGFETSVEVAEALDSLAVEHRAVLMLAVVEGFTCRETAQILNVPTGTVMSRLSRARDALRAKLTPMCASKGAP
jgi:RNA polymerase sigma-70 factor (ECF subfamily)